MTSDRGSGRAERPADLTAVADLVEVMDVLRSPGGCPWDAEQTHRSLLKHLVEEAHEVVEAVEVGDRDDLVEELGDLLLQVVFHARLGEERVEGRFDLDEVAAGVAGKLRRRHPHVFEVPGGTSATAADAHGRWEQAKQAEKARASVLDGIPATLPALARAQKVVGRARRAGVLAGPAARRAGVGDEHGSGAPPDARVGAALLDLVREAEALGVDAEGALREAARAFEAQVRAAEARTRGSRA